MPRHEGSAIGRCDRLDRDSLSAATRLLVDDGYVATGPEEAFQSIENTFSAAPSGDGRNCPGITILRKLVAEVDPGLASAVMITAPHTHWKSGDYILEQFDTGSDRYLIGPSGTLPQSPIPPFAPLSFVFHVEGPMPYEWADGSCDFVRDAGLGRLLNGLETLNRKVIERFRLPFPLGISVNHRFKALWDMPRAGTHEQPASEDHRYAAVCRVTEPAQLDPIAVQVGWSAFLVEEYTEREHELLRQLDAAVEGKSPEEASRFFDELEHHARTASALPPESVG